MSAGSLQTFLDRHQVTYVTMRHSPAFTAQEIAVSAHIPGTQPVKSVIVKLDGQLTMAVLPASDTVHVEHLQAVAGARTVALANEQNVQDRFPECKVGVMAPVGHLYGLDVWAAARWAEDEEIASNTGDHTALMRLAYRDVDRLVQPTVGPFSSIEALYPVPRGGHGPRSKR